MPRFEVRLELDIDCVQTPIQAAELAWKLIRNDGSIANHFTVRDEAGNIEKVDLMEHYGDAGRPEDLADLAPELEQALQLLIGNGFPVSTGNVSGLNGCGYMVRSEDVEAAKLIIDRSKKAVRNG